MCERRELFHQPDEPPNPGRVMLMYFEVTYFRGPKKIIRIWTPQQDPPKRTSFTFLFIYFASNIGLSANTRDMLFPFETDSLLNVDDEKDF